MVCIFRGGFFFFLLFFVASNTVHQKIPPSSPRQPEHSNPTASCQDMDPPISRWLPNDIWCTNNIRRGDENTTIWQRVGETISNLFTSNRNSIPRPMPRVGIGLGCFWRSRAHPTHTPVCSGSSVLRWVQANHVGSNVGVAGLYTLVPCQFFNFRVGWWIAADAIEKSVSVGFHIRCRN